LEAGASVVVLSGAGPGLLAFAPSGHDAIGAAMAAAFTRAGLRARYWTLEADGPGLAFG
jgi:homoserine kinase